MSRLIGHGRYARETYPEGPRVGSGAQGPQGAPGAQGPQGNSGAQGPQGSVGPQGAAGAQGPQGAQGAQGDPAIGGFGLYSARPAQPQPSGEIYIASDGGPNWVSDGAEWRPNIFGRVGKQVPLVATWTAFGSAGTATFTDEAGRIVGTTSGTADVVSGLVVTKPATYDARVHIGNMVGAGGGSLGGAGIVLRSSTVGNSLVWIVTVDRLLIGSQYTNDTTPAGVFSSDTIGDYRWLRVEDDGVNLNFYSGDGILWKLNAQLASGFGGFDTIGLGFVELNQPRVQYDSWELL